MNTKDTLNIAKKVCGFAIGWTVGSIAATTTKPKGFVDATLCMIGSTAIAFTVGQVFDREFTALFEKNFSACEEDETV